MAYAYATRWVTDGVVHDLRCRDFPPLEDRNSGIECNFDGTLPPDPPADSPTENTVEEERVVEAEPPMVWEVIENWFQVRLRRSFEKGIIRLSNILVPQSQRGGGAPDRFRLRG